jgi:hypothetical protein
VENIDIIAHVVNAINDAKIEWPELNEEDSPAGSVRASKTTVLEEIVSLFKENAKGRFELEKSEC